MIKFNKKAMQKFNQIPDDIKSKTLSNVYCSACKGTTTIVDFVATVDRNDLVLTGKCNKCSGEVIRLIER
ncbi:hypothetical protein [Sulfurimonas sp.]|uniref:hypothetical protein n=1 Tax=Sulfurimonas sp. TaxID=2022749 RepID=UPI0025CE4B73|nr:hypothetical protein [Sulfurimonas sp.]MCK9454730.1 hypothetical protein [Sulfurimonas sp.]